MKVLVLDDDKRICSLITSLLNKYYAKEFKDIDIATNADEAILSLKSKNYQLLLFDIDLGQQTSFEVLETLQDDHVKVIFITGHEKYAISAIKAGAVDYILKPIQIQEFKNAIDKALVQIASNSNDLNAHLFSKKQENSLLLKAIESIQLVKLNAVVYLEASGPYTYVYLDNNTKITVTKHLKDFEKRLVNSGFFRIHNSFMINTLKMKSIQKKDGLSVEMINKKTIVISTRRKDDFMAYIERYLEI